MAVQEYVKTALSNLNGAVTHLQNEISQTRAQLDQDIKSIEHEITLLNTQASTFDQQARGAQDNSDQIRLQGLIVIERRKADEKQKEVSLKQAETTKIIHDKEQLVQQLKALTSQVEQMSYSPLMK